MRKTSSRLLALLSLLQTHRDWSGDDLAERLDVTPRTVRRDIDRLRELGYPISAFKGPAGGYRLEAGSRLPPLLFDDGQAVALALALQAAATDPAIGEDAVRALATLRQVMPPRLRHRIDTARVTAVRPVREGSAPPAGTRGLMELSRVIHAREELRFDYGPDAAACEGPPRRAQPHHLVTWRGHWYVVAWDLDRGDWRTFRADRVHPRTPTGPRFTPRDLPIGDVAGFVTGRFRGTDGSTTDWPCRGEVVLDLPARSVAPLARDGIVEELGPGRCRLTLGSWSWTGLATAIGRFDTAVHVVGPPELSDAFTRLAARYADAGRGSNHG
ncbi:helix-turn-helix transcriptional regulator [Streptomyces naganishii]|uniref:DeoR family transcriptional regulator n=1 Tax=Streptomyces naganishii JCM 4654 TaxID=1306179 RepID=A0A918Y1Q5_9ACTN|nr:WYL domain-containing protein [Streptomyces naganishii]GHD87059.1 DeoR family transcriptional regulator [Streptomyces naganishii JCM 4654]